MSFAPVRKVEQEGSFSMIRFRDTSNSTWFVRTVSFISSLSLLLLSTPLMSSSQASTKKYKMSVAIYDVDWGVFGLTYDEANNLSECADGAGIDEGITVKIKNSKNRLIGAGNLKWAIADVREDNSDFAEGYWAICYLVADIKSLPKVDFYQVSIGKIDGGAYSFKALVKRDWILQLKYWG